MLGWSGSSRRIRVEMVNYQGSIVAMSNRVNYRKSRFCLTTRVSIVNLRKRPQASPTFTTSIV
jgi:hypothetical protein